MTRAAKIWWGVGGGIALFLVLCCSGVILLVWQVAEDPPNIAVQVDYPNRVAPNETFTITVHITNEGQTPRTLHSIDIYDGYLAGVQITDGEPEWTSSSNIFGSTKYSYDTPLAPGEEQIVVFSVQAVRPGDFTGDLDVMIDNDFSFMTHVLRTIVSDDGP